MPTPPYNPDPQKVQQAESTLQKASKQVNDLTAYVNGGGTLDPKKMTSDLKNLNELFASVPTHK